jgi:hypothetical protein
MLTFRNVMRYRNETLQTVEAWFWLVPVVLGIGLISGGLYMASEGNAAKDDVRDSVVQEDITVAEDAPAFGGETVDSAAKADARRYDPQAHTGVHRWISVRTDRPLPAA